MKKFLPLMVVGILVLSGLGAVAINVEKEKNTETMKNEKLGSGPKDYTHTVFVEIGTGQFCGPCHSWNSNIYNTYSTGQYDFEYVEMIIWGHGGFSDILNTKAHTWRSLYGINSIPTSIFDGDYRKIVGNYPDQLAGALDACGQRSVKDLEASMTVQWLGDAEIKVDIEIENNEATTYNGYIRVPITEITSRYTTAGGSKYHYGFLDWAFNKGITISAGGVYTDSVTWDGDEHQDNHGTNFGDITPENIKVIMGIFNDNNDYVDETVSALVTVNEPPEKPTILSGPTSGKAGKEYCWMFHSDDLDGDMIYYIIDWGDGTTNETECKEPCTFAEACHTFTEQKIYIIKIKAKECTPDGLESDWAELTVTMARNRIATNSPILQFFENHPYLFPILQALLLKRLGLQ